MTTSNISILIHYENHVNLFPNLFSPYVTNTMAQSSVYHLLGEKLNDNNYFLWSQLVKMVLE